MEGKVAERFKPVEDFPGYRVSDQGRVQTCKVMRGRYYRDVHGGTWRDLKPIRHRSGHFAVSLRRNGKCFRRYVHRLVLFAFVGPPPAGMECCHDGDDPSDNRLCKLRWGTKSQNLREAIANGKWKPPAAKRGDRNPQAKITDSQAAEIKTMRTAGVRLRIIAAEFGISEAHVSRIALGRCR